MNLRFKTKKLVVGRVKAYSLNDNEDTLTISNDEVGYLGSANREVYAVTKDQKIMLRAFLVDNFETKQQQDNRAKTPQGEGYQNTKDDIIFLDGDNLESSMKDEIIWAYKLVNKNHFSSPHSHSVATNDYVKIHGTEDDPKTGLSISIKLSDIITEIQPDQIVVFFAFPGGYEDNDETDEIKPRYRSQHGVFRSAGHTEQRIKHIASIALKVIEDRYRLLYDGREFILLDDERISKTYPIIKTDANTWEPLEGTYSVIQASLGSLLASHSGNRSNRFRIFDEVTKIFDVVLKSSDEIIKGFDVAPKIFDTHNTEEVIIVAGSVSFLIDDIRGKGIKTLQVKLCEGTVIEITRFKQTMNSTTSRYVIYTRQKNGRYVPLYALGGAENDAVRLREEVKLQDKLIMGEADAYQTLIYGGYILECAGPDTIMGEIELRIPEGYYNAVWHDRPKPKKDALKLYSEHVSADRAILIHVGNEPIDILGCLLPGELKRKEGEDKDEDGDGYKI